MKKLSVIALFLLCCIGKMISQSNNSLTVFTEGGERFYLILNGVKQNTTAETNVKATGINGQQVKAKVIFDQQGIPDCDKTVPMMWAAEPVSNNEFVFSIKKNKKGQYKWNFVSQSPIQAVSNVTNTNNNQSQNIASNNSQNTTQNLNTTNSNTNTNLNVQTNGGGANNSVTTTTSSTTTTNNANNNANGQIGINFGVNVPGMNINMNVNDGSLNNTNVNTNTNSTTTITTTTTTTSYTTSTGNNNVNQSNNNTNLNNNVGNQNNQSNTNVSNTSGCGVAMTNAEYNDAKKSIEAKPFDDTRLNIAKGIADNNCMTVEQIKGIASVFSFEDNKLDFAKYAYDRCTEKKNYYKVGDIFKFDSNVNELNDYVKSKK